ncbi:MAG: hypothetical protein M3R02_29520 [Chloroflexota bacterium]|nr:hypothetical protein [Chloroflexota bacterium]
MPFGPCVPDGVYLHAGLYQDPGGIIHPGLFEDTGPHTGTKAINVRDADTYVLVVETEGSWAITVGQ